MTTFLLVVELFAAYVFCGMLVVLFCFAAYDWWRDRDAQRRIRRLTANTEAYERAEREAMELDYLYLLPAREPHRGA